MNRSAAAHAAAWPEGLGAMAAPLQPKSCAAVQALPQAWVAYGWAKHSDGHCSYKGYRSQHCPDKQIHFWDQLLNEPYGVPSPPAPGEPGSIGGMTIQLLQELCANHGCVPIRS